MKGRPRHSARSTYVSTPKDQDVEETAVEDQPLAAEDLLAPNPTPEASAPATISLAVENITRKR
jgi:hypothetical protein